MRTIYLQSPSSETSRAAAHAQAIFDAGRAMWPPRETARVQLDGTGDVEDPDAVCAFHAAGGSGPCSYCER